MDFYSLFSVNSPSTTRLLHLRTVPPYVTAHICCASRNASITLSARAKVNLLAHDDATKRATKNAKTAFLRPNPVYVHLLKQEQQKNNIIIPTKH